MHIQNCIYSEFSMQKSTLSTQLSTGFAGKTPHFSGFWGFIHICKADAYFLSTDFGLMKSNLILKPSGNMTFSVFTHLIYVIFMLSQALSALKSPFFTKSVPDNIGLFCFELLQNYCNHTTFMYSLRSHYHYRLWARAIVSSTSRAARSCNMRISVLAPGSSAVGSMFSVPL